MKYFAIKNTRTGEYLSAPRGRDGRGSTHVNFGDKGKPRLFDTHGAAKATLKWWLNGEVFVTYSCDPWGEVDEDWRVKPRPERRAEEVAVVEVMLLEFERIAHLEAVIRAQRACLELIPETEDCRSAIPEVDFLTPE